MVYGLGLAGVVITFADYDRIWAQTFYDIYDIKEAEIERQNREIKKARDARKR